MTLGGRIQSLRKMQGISQDELANKIGVSRQAISKWENDQSIPDLDKVIVLSDYFSATTDYILKGEDTPQQEYLKGEDTTKQANNGFDYSQLLYIASIAFLLMGLFSAFDGWSADKSLENIWGSIIIQVLGGVAYFIGRLMEHSKTPLIYSWFTLILALFVPVSMVTSFVLDGIVAPYPGTLLGTILFSIIYTGIGVLFYFSLKRF